VTCTPEQILRYAKTIAVVGASRDPTKSADRLAIRAIMSS
jgi:predicted CoA-binding protein